MKDQWYGDKRDLVKWGVLLNLASDHSANRIMHVAYLRPSEWAQLLLDGRERPIPEAVLRHFRNVRNIRSLSAGPRIEVLEIPFVDRQKYSDAILKAIARRRGGAATVVFLDPDTGLAPRRAGFEHVLDSEVNEIWKHILPRDVLVLYQHQTNRNARPWIEGKRRQFAEALGISRGGVKVASSMGIARDVAFFYCCKRTRL